MAFPTLATETKCSGGVPGVTAPHLHCVPLHPLCAGEVQAFYEDLSGRQYVNEVFNFSVDKLYDLLFTDSPFQRDFMEQRRFSGPPPPRRMVPPTPSLSVHTSSPPFPGHPMARGTPFLAHAVPELLGALPAPRPPAPQL